MSNSSSDAVESAGRIDLAVRHSKARDLTEAAAILAGWFSAKVADSQSVQVLSLEAPTTNGGSNETYIATLAAERDGQMVPRKCVIRLKPRNHQLFLRDCFADQFRLLSFLHAHTDVPVPRMDFYEDDESILGVPFFVMECVEGRVPPDMPPYPQAGFLREASVAQRRHLWESGIAAAAAVARVDVAAMPAILPLAPGQSGMEENLRHWERHMNWVCDDRPSALFVACLEWLQARMPERRATALSWGDCRIGNMIFRDWTCVAVIDWEAMSLAGPQLDLAHWLEMDEYFATGLGGPRLEGMGTREETIERWEEHSGFRADQLEWHSVLAAFRLALNEHRGMSLMPPEARDALRLPDGDTVLNRRLRKVFEFYR